MADHWAALFSISRSLWDRVTPDLRGVAYTLTASDLAVRFMYEVEPTELILDLVNDAEGECIADFWPTVTVSFVAESLPVDQPRRIKDAEGERWFFLRYESSDPP